MIYRHNHIHVPFPCSDGLNRNHNNIKTKKKIVENVHRNYRYYTLHDAFAHYPWTSTTRVYSTSQNNVKCLPLLQFLVHQKKNNFFVYSFDQYKIEEFHWVSRRLSFKHNYRLLCCFCCTTKSILRLYNVHSFSILHLLIRLLYRVFRFTYFVVIVVNLAFLYNIQIYSID